MDSKLIFFDIDGTLMDERGAVQESSSLALLDLKNKGHQIFVASGRCLAEVPRKILDIGFDGMVLGNGTYVEYQGQEIYHSIMDGKKVVEFGKVLEAGQAAIFFSSKEGCYVRSIVHENFTRVANENPETLGFWKEFLDITKIFADIYELEHKGIEKVNFHGFQGDFHPLKEAFKDYFTIVPSSIPNRPKGISGEVCNVGISKATGIKHLLKHINKENGRFIAFGDNHNDIDMIKAADIGVVMGNGVDDLKAHGDIITSSVTEDGIIKALKKLELL